jgi:hypothetical protein
MAVGATATSPAAAIPLRATFKKPLREMSCIVNPPSVDEVEPFGGFVGLVHSNDRLGACGTEDYSPPFEVSDVPARIFLSNLEQTPGR